MLLSCSRWMHAVVALLATGLVACVQVGDPCDGDCGSNLRCVFRDGLRVCADVDEPYCRSAADCLPGRSCTNGVCAQPCTSSDECSPVEGCCGMTCDLEATSQSRICFCNGCE